MPVNHFPPWEVAAKIAVSLGVGLLVGIEREWSNKDLGARTFALAALLGTLAALFGPVMVIPSLAGILLIIVFANARSFVTNRTLEITTSTALLVMFVMGALAGQGHLFTPVAAAILMTMLLTWKGELHRCLNIGPTDLGKLGFLGISMAGGLVSSASTSAASALINLPIIHRNARNPTLSRRLTIVTLILSALGVAVPFLQAYHGPFRN